MKTKILSILLAGTVFLSSGMSVFAQDNIVEDNTETMIEIEQEETIVTEIKGVGDKQKDLGNIGLTSGAIRGPNVPTAAHDWASGSYPISGDTSMNTWLYTEKYFTNFTDATLKLTAYGSSGIYPRGDVKMCIYRKEVLGDTVVYSDTISAGTTKTFNLSNYSSSKKYYIKFSGIMNISGSLAKK